MQGFSVYLPLRRHTVRHARRIYETTEAFFSRYLFVKLDLKRARWRSINSTVGVVYLLSCRDQPLTAEPGLIEAMQAATGPDGILRPVEVIRPGQKVRIISGAFANYFGKLERSTREDAVRILIDMMDRTVPVHVTKESVVAIRS